MDATQIIQVIVLYAIPGIFAITLHEAAHGYAARHFGDPTAAQAGRISLNPVRHIDPIGTLLMPALILFFSKGQFAFGWAKPVPVNFGRLRHPKRDMLWVAAAGPGANLAMAILWAVLIKVAGSLPAGYFTEPLLLMARGGVIINVVLMVLNLLPLPPLDGGRIAVSLLPHGVADRYARIEPFGLVIVLLLMFTGVLSVIMWPFIAATISAIAGLFGIGWIF
ncbi:MAG TPA: site-2 protease family protein [Burkholderiales bacterium]|jgi:Zn-dependent protease|nr:site-2 protease family protein [Burkholderiales bacterium]